MRKVYSLKSITETLASVAFIILLSFTLLLSGCNLLGTCEELQYIGSLELDEESKAAYPSHYLSLSEVRFSNESGDVREYSVSNKQGHGARTLFENVGTCDVEPYDAIYSYYESEEILTHLFGEETSFSIMLNTVAERSLLYDVVEVLYAEENTVVNHMSFVTALKDNSIVPENLEKFDTLYQEVTFRGRIFENVYQSSEEDDAILYFSFDRGIIAVQLANDLWLVEE